MTVGVINNVDEAGAETKIGEARAVIESFNMAVCPKAIYHRPQFQAAIEKGKGVTEAGSRAKKAAEEIEALWIFLDRRNAQSSAGKMPRKKREAAKP